MKHLKTVFSFLIPLLLLPFAALLGTVLPGKRTYLLFTLLAAGGTLALFYLGIEKKNIGTRRQVACAILTALSTAGRFIPFFKPVTAISVLGGMWLGKEAGFLIGSLSALVSDLWFGMGPWTPFQMLGWGLTGYFAALTSPVLKKNRALLCLYGALCGVLFSLVMDVWTVVGMGGEGISFADTLRTALPFTALYAVSNAVFLWLLAPSIGRKLQRVKKKYGI